MLTVEEALDAILQGVEPLAPARVPLLRAHGLALAEDVVADIDSPPFDNSAVDGYAVRAADTLGASADTPRALRCVGEAPAGAVPPQDVNPGTCLRVMTGAPLPAGADAMVMVEDTRVSGDAVLVCAETRVGDHVRYRGEGIRAGARVLVPGARIGAAETALLASVGRATVLCHPRPRVAAFSTGDELVEVDAKPGPGQIRDTNGPMLAALVAEAGAELHDTGRLRDDQVTVEAAFRRAAGRDGSGSPAADVIVTSGGVSVGDRDFVKPALERLGQLDLWRVRMKPGKPLAFGRIGRTLFFGLPGNPASTMVTFELFVRPVLRRLAGLPAADRPRVHAVLAEPVEHVPGRREYVRARLRLEDGRWIARPTGAQGSSLLLSMVGANGLVIVPEESGDLAAGETVEALLLSEYEG